MHWDYKAPSKDLLLRYQPMTEHLEEIPQLIMHDTSTTLHLLEANDSHPINRML